MEYNNKFPENPSNGSLVVPCAWSDIRTDRKTEMTELLVDFCNFANSREEREQGQ
jgi:hypothetical protein